MDKKSVNIPTYIFVLIVLLIAVMVFIFLVHAPFREQRPIYESNHASAVSQISLYNDYLSRADSVQAKIDEMRAEYEERSAKLFVNAKQSPDDIRDMVNGLNYELNNFTITEGVPDSEGRSTVAGYPLYSTSIALTFTASEETLLATLDYLEIESDGSYYVNTLNVNAIEQASGATSTEQLYNVNLSMNLYYFNTEVEPTKPASSSQAESSK